MTDLLHVAQTSHWRDRETAADVHAANMKATVIASLTTALATALVSSAAFAQGAPAQDPPALPPVSTSPAEKPAAEPVPAVAPVPEPVPEPVQPAVVVAAPPAAKSAGYDKGFFIKSDDGKFELKIKARVQALYNLTSKVANDDRSETGTFSIRRARLTLEGHVFGNKLNYKFQTDFGRGLVHLKDFTADAKVGDHVWIRAGQWKKPFSRQQVVSSANLELVDRAITDGAFHAGRDIGIAVHNDYEKSPKIEWVVGVFSGINEELPAFSGTTNPTTGAVTGSFGFTPKTTKPLLVARLGYNHNKIKGYGPEADLDGGALRAAVAVSGIVEFDADRNSLAEHRVQADFVVKNDGLSVSGAGYLMTAGTGVADNQGLTLAGVHVQGGYVVDKKWQPAARVALLKALGDNNAATVTDLNAGVNYYYHGNDAKVMFDLGLRKTGDASFGDDVRANVSMHLGF